VPANPRNSASAANSAGQTAILSAAAKLFADQGYEAVSIRSLADRAGVSKANIYHHFGSKRGLYLAVLRDAVEQTIPIIDTVAASHESVERQLSVFARQHLQKSLKLDHPLRLLLREALESTPGTDKELAEQVVGRSFERIATIISAGQISAELRSDLDPAICATLLVAANIFFFQSRKVLRHFPDAAFAEDPERYSAAVIDILLNGMSNTDPHG